MSITPSNEYEPLISSAGFMNSDPENLTYSFTEIDAAQMNELRKNPSTIIIDVRERHEFPELDSGIYQQVPMSVFETFASTEIAAQNIVLICQHGIRSVAAVELLHQNMVKPKKYTA